MVSNCGFLTPRFYDVNCFNIGADITGGNIPYFHSLLCEWAYNVSLPFLWVVVIDAQNRRHLTKTITEVGELEPTYKGQWEVNQREVDTVFNYRTQDVIGCVFAQGVSIPGESMGIDYAGADPARSNGHLKGPMMTSRTDLSPLEITFNETNVSFTDFFIRPWSIVAGYKGFLADDGNGLQGSGPYWGGSIKSNIHVYQLAKGGSNFDNCAPNIVRKEFHFFDAVPININNDELTYEGGGGFNKRQVTFAYNYYTVNAGNG